MLPKTLQFEAMLGGRLCSVTLQKKGVFYASGTNQKCSKFHLGIDPRDDDNLHQTGVDRSAQARDFGCVWIVGPTQ